MSVAKERDEIVWAHSLITQRPPKIHRDNGETRILVGTHTYPIAACGVDRPQIPLPLKRADAIKALRCPRCWPPDAAS